MDSLGDFDLWELDLPTPTILCDGIDRGKCSNRATRRMKHYHLSTALPIYCTDSIQTLVCEDHRNLLRKRAKMKAEQDKPCWRCKKPVNEYYELILEDEPLL